MNDNTLDGHYFDGRKPIGITATLVLTGNQATLAHGDQSRTYPIPSLRVTPPAAGADRFIQFPDGGQLQCAAGPLLDRLPADSATEGPIAWLESHVGVAIGGIVLIAVLLAGGYFFGVPYAAERIAMQLPLESEQKLGDDALKWLDNQRWFGPSEIDENLQFMIRQEFADLKAPLPLADRVRLEIRHATFAGPNAFALPGGTVVLTDGMIRAAESLDELMAVLAHELGHVERRHTLRQVLQGSIVALVTTVLTADAASLTVAVTGAPVLLLNAKYSRSFETEADTFAFDLLRREGRSPEAFATLMERMQDGKGDGERQFAFLSTHPVTADRINRARAAARSDSAPVAP